MSSKRKILWVLYGKYLQEEKIFYPYAVFDKKYKIDHPKTEKYIKRLMYISWIEQAVFFILLLSSWGSADIYWISFLFICIIFYELTWRYLVRDSERIE